MIKVPRQIIATAIALFALSAFAQQADWPTKPVRWVVPFAPGGSADAAARNIAQKLTERWGQQVLVDNRPGGHTAIAAVEVARAAPDGYTLFQPINATLTLNQFILNKMPYDVQRDFTLIGTIVSVPQLILANDTLPAKTILELVALAKAKPGSISMGNGSLGLQLSVERFVRDADIKVLSVPYKSGADMAKGLLSGEIQAGLDGSASYPPFIKTGKLRALATSNSKRIASMPEVPTLAELGFKNSETPLWHAVLAPAGLPPKIQKKIAADLQAVLALPDLKERLGALGLEPWWQNADELTRLIKSESAYMGPLAKELGLKVE